MTTRAPKAAPTAIGTTVSAVLLELDGFQQLLTVRVNKPGSSS